MADKGAPHFHNDVGVAIVHVGAKEFMCIGAVPPFDHPMSFSTLGKDTEIICPYCSTLFRYRGDLGGHAADPASCVWAGPQAA